MRLSCTKSCRERIPLRVHNDRESSCIKCSRVCKGIWDCGVLVVNVSRADAFFQACTEAFIVGDRDVGTVVPSGVLSSQVFKLGRVSEEFSISPQSVFGYFWNQEGNWARFIAK